MKLNLRPVIAGASALVITGGVLAATVGTAAAAGTPPWEPDPGSLGSLTLYDAAGNVVTGGNNLSHLFDYAQGSTPDANTGIKATLDFAQPTFGVATGNWPVGQASTSVVTPPTAAGTPPALAASTTPVATSGPTGANLTNFIASQVPQTQPGFVNVYQLRVVTTGGNGGSSGNAQYWEDDIQVDPAAGTWTQVFPGAVQPTTTTLTALPSPALTTDSVTLTATESPATAGSVDFEDGATDLGSVPVDGNGVATLTQKFSATGSHPLTATFTPTDAADFSGSSGKAVLQVNPPATPTTTALTVNQATPGFAGGDISLSAVVSASSGPVGAGSVEFFDGSTDLGPGTGGTPLGTWLLDIHAGLPVGSHSIVAKFTPTDVTQFEASQSPASSFFLSQPAETGSPCAQPGSQCTDTQNIQTSVPIGTLVINTPYTPTNPLILPDMTLNASSTAYSTNAVLTCIAVTDTTSGGAPFTAQAVASPLVDTTPPSSAPVGSFNTINPENVGLTDFTMPTGADALCPDTQSYNPGTVTTTGNPAAAAVPPSDNSGGGLGVAKTFATGSGGNGTVTLDGTLTIDAPTSTQSGLYTGTVTFTVSD